MIDDQHPTPAVDPPCPFCEAPPRADYEHRYLLRCSSPICGRYYGKE